MNPRSWLLAGVLALSGIACPAHALEPFEAHYKVFNSGRALGDATLQLVQVDAQRWRVDLTMRGSGLYRIAGLNAQQSTVFELLGETYRPLSQATVRRALFTQKRTIGVYDWSTRQARWQGDVKKTRTAPVGLKDGDMSGLLIDLAVIRDAQPGRVLDYRFVDDGRARDQRYQVAAQREGVTIEGLAYDALRVSRVHGGSDETMIWVVDGVPTPIRLLQRENGEDTYDLRLIDYKGA